MRRTYANLTLIVAAAVLSALSAPQPLSAQERGAIRGTVTDVQTGETIAGAQISIRGTEIGTLTNESGRYLLTNVTAGQVELRVEYLGYAPASHTLTVQPGETATHDFELGVTAIELEELVATGYAQQTRREVGSAISSVDDTDIANNVVASLDGALQGKAAGVQVIQNAGNPGNGMTVRVRGSASISASSQPLYVVDGVPVFRGDFSQLGLGGQDLSAITGLNPDDIESINILKDASAAAIYGSRGSNGVVMITTKRGKMGAPTFTVNVSAGTQQISKKIDLLDTEGWVDYFSQAMANDGYTEQEIQDELDWLGVDMSINTDWQDEVLRTAPVTNTQVSVNGGTERFKYFVSGSFFDQEGIIIGSAYDRASGRANVDIQATERLKLGVSLALTQEVNDRIESDNSITSAVTNAIANEPWAPVFADDGSYSSVASYANPVGIGMLNEVEARTIRGFGNVTAELSILPWLRATGRAGFDLLSLREYEYQSSEVGLTYASGVDGVSQIANSQGRRQLLEGYVTANPLTGTHELGITAGSSVELNTREESYLRGEGFTSPDLHWPANAARNAGFDGTTWDHNLLSYFGRANYTFDNRYILNGSLRVDGSSRFGPDNKYGTFPSVSIAWVVSNESFMSDMDFITDLKLRGSWGMTGNEAIGDFRFLGLYSTANYGDIAGTGPSNLPNSELKWETTTEWNVGIDLGLLNDRIGVVAELYNKATDDLLLSRPVTSTSGFTSVMANVGGIENRGWELTLRTVNVRSGGQGLEWTTDFSVTHNQNEVTRLYSPDPNEPGEPFMGAWYNRVEEGEPLGAFYTYEYAGVDPDNGDALYTDLDADGNVVGTTTTPSSDDRMIVGSPHPDYFGGLRNTVRFAGLDLMVFFEYSFGAEIFNAMREFADDGGYFYDNKFADVAEDYWTPDNTDASQPRPSYWGTSGARIASSRWMEDASYVRLGELTLGYQLPQAAARLLGSQNARLYISGKNLYTWTDYTGYAPDLNSFGSDAGSAALGTDFYTYPVARTLSIGFQGTWQ